MSYNKLTDDGDTTRGTLEHPGGRVSNHLGEAGLEGGEQQPYKGSLVAKFEKVEKFEKIEKFEKVEKFEQVEGGHRPRVSFGNLSREVRGMIWKEAVADFVPLQLEVTKRPFIDRSFSRADVSQADYESYYRHFQWDGDASENGRQSWDDIHRMGNILLLRPTSSNDSGPPSETDVVSRIRHNQNLMLVCREARLTVEQVLPAVLPLSGNGAMRINPAVDTFWLTYDYQIVPDGIHRPFAPIHLPPREAREEGRQLAVYDRDWNYLVYNVADVDAAIMNYHWHEQLRVCPSSKVDLSIHFERFHEYPNLTTILLPCMLVLDPACQCRKCSEIRQEELWPTHGLPRLEDIAPDMAGRSSRLGLPEAYTIHREVRHNHNYGLRILAHGTANLDTTGVSRLFHDVKTVGEFEVAKYEPDARLSVTFNFQHHGGLRRCDTIRAVYYRFAWQQTPTISFIVDVDTAIKNISGRDWVAERLGGN